MAPAMLLGWGRIAAFRAPRIFTRKLSGTVIKYDTTLPEVMPNVES
jgi:hypothetical protein